MKQKKGYYNETHIYEQFKEYKEDKVVHEIRHI